ncbi:hypothetical protein P280DRAFT_242108 [Massarina eburnea CBS 473.64]|uniref:Uncharacterized protein n=1 Tax=Massarina eburnea CBS 473.64 TaxID=1395130 RepID=A0A6A6S8E9_9PLEO|nr:hypothetical protein P280DRAFT_242108 [Massarina eburnea CBS 473.64]
MEGKLVVQRQVVGDFDENRYYRFSNANGLSPNNTISAGLHRDSNGAINMTKISVTTSSENWQLYYQGGRYFIRNWDFGGDWQLGLTADSRSDPKMLKRSGAVGQQWTLAKSADGKGYLVTNGLLGNGSFLALSGINTVPAMQPSASGGLWDIQINPSAGSSAGTMLQDVANFEVSSSSSTSSTLSTSSPSPSPTSSITDSSPPASTTPTTNAPAQPSLAPSSSSGLSTGAVVGIAIAGVAILIASAVLAWFFLLRRKKQKNQTGLHSTTYEVPEGGNKMVYAYSAEVGNSEAVYEAQHKGYDEPRYEMDGSMGAERGVDGKRFRV